MVYKFKEIFSKEEMISYFINQLKQEDEYKNKENNITAIIHYLNNWNGKIEDFHISGPHYDLYLFTAIERRFRNFLENNIEEHSSKIDEAIDDLLKGEEDEIPF